MNIYIDCLDEGGKNYCEGKDCGCYLFVDEKLTWNSARRWCQKFGGELAMAKTDEKVMFVTDLTTTFAWLGASFDINSGKKGKWKWRDGAIVEQEVLFWNGGDSYWTEFRRSNQFLTINFPRVGKFYSYSIHHIFPFICEFPYVGEMPRVFIYIYLFTVLL